MCMENSQKLLGEIEKERTSSRDAVRVGKRQWKTVSSQLAYQHLKSDDQN